MINFEDSRLKSLFYGKLQIFGFGVSCVDHAKVLFLVSTLQ